jgi:hypothetical protein
MSASFAEIVSGRIIPILENGVEKGSIQLDKTDCENILFMLRTSIPLEPFLNLFVEMIHKATTDYRRENADVNGSDFWADRLGPRVRHKPQKKDGAAREVQKKNVG